MSTSNAEAPPFLKMGLSLRLGLCLPLLVATLSIVAFYITPNGAWVTMFILASSVSLASAGVAIYRLAQGSLRWSFTSASLTGLGVLTSIPVILLVAAFVQLSLPLTASERQAIQIAETFVARNGYTSAGHPKDQPVLQNDILDPLAGSAENLKKMRRGTLQSTALGVRHDWGSGEILVLFEDIPSISDGTYRAVAVNSKGEARILHSDLVVGPWYKKNKR